MNLGEAIEIMPTFLCENRKGTYVRKSEVLDLLERHLGEYAAGHTFTSRELAELDIFNGPCPPGRARTIKFHTGDRIAIYVRRKNG